MCKIWSILLRLGGVRLRTNLNDGRAQDAAGEFIAGLELFDNGGAVTLGGHGFVTMRIKGLAERFEAGDAQGSKDLVELSADGVDGFGPSGIGAGGTVLAFGVETVAYGQEFAHHAGGGKTHEIGAVGFGPAAIVLEFGLEALQIGRELGHAVVAGGNGLLRFGLNVNFGVVGAGGLGLR